MYEWVSVWVSELESEWVSFFTSVKQLMTYADVHLVKVNIIFVFCFSFLAFRFSLFAFR